MSDRFDDAPNLAIFCDFENVAIGVREAKYDVFDIHLVLERLLDKGNIVVKKAYADWDRFKSLKKTMHEAAFELIEIPHVSYSGKNSADIRMVVDALDLCYTKSHVHAFVVISGDSDFSPLVSKLRENNKKVIGVGVKHTSSDLLIDNCDEYIFYDDLVRDKRQVAAPSKGRHGHGRDRHNNGRAEAPVAPATAPEVADKPAALEAQPLQPKANHTKADEVGPKEEAFEIVLETAEALFRERDENLWGSMLKQTIKRKKPHFSETFFGFRNFSDLLEEAERRGLLEIAKDDKSGGYLIVGFGPAA